MKVAGPDPQVVISRRSICSRPRLRLSRVGTATIVRSIYRHAVAEPNPGKIVVPNSRREDPVHDGNRDIDRRDQPRRKP